MGETSQDPTVFVLFGATGDLSHRMVMPAFYDLAARGLMPPEWMLVGNGRGTVSDEAFRADARGAVQAASGSVDEADWSEFADHLRFAGGGFTVDDPGDLVEVLADARDRIGDGVRLVHYLALPPVAFEPITTALDAHGLLQGSRVCYEKPYGTSPQSFAHLDELVHSVMDEEQVFRIDHFLGKEATQDLHVVRYANAMFASIWDRHSIEQVQIDVPETLDVADRAGFYDATGAFRDMVATHLFQVAAEVAMEPPVSFAADDLQEAREAVIAAFRPLDPAEVVFGQADGYRDLPDVADHSTTETYAAARLWIDTDRWHGVPFVLRSGKQLAASYQRVSLIIREPDATPAGIAGRRQVVSFSLAGDGSIEMSVGVKKPGPDLTVVDQVTTLDLGRVPDSETVPPYVALLHDITVGDRSLFTSSAGLQRAWAVADPVLGAGMTPASYQPGSDGPEASLELTDGLGWVGAGFETG